MRLLFPVARLLLPYLFAAASLAAAPAFAWIYPEHRDLTLLALQGLDEAHMSVFDRLWQDARAGDAERLCAQGADSGQGLTPSCIDWAALPAIAGDHSCSSREMFETARASSWILLVADVAAQLKVDLSRIPVTMPPDTISGSKGLVTDARRRIASQGARAERVNVLRTADIRFERADPGYATRAGANNAHFLMSRPSTDISLYDYARLTLRPGSELNAVGVYSFFHLSALQKASRLANERHTAQQRQALARAAMADEAFALHFLEDAYAAGHIAGSWGDASQRQGTHDYYNQNGLEVFTWSNGSQSVVLMGDANLRPEDAAVAASAVRRSLEQVLDAATGSGNAFAYTPDAVAELNNFDICRNNTLPDRAPGTGPRPEDIRFFEATLRETPVPGLGPGLGAMPRFRSEVGPFIGLAGSIDARWVDGGFVASQGWGGFVGGLDLSVRAGFGLDGVMGEAGDGLVYASVGFRTDSPSSNRFGAQVASGGNLGAAIPARSGLALRLRMPFYVVPGDLLLLAPLYLVNPSAYTQVAVRAANGGLIPWESGWSTAIGRFQVVLGREIGVTLYGLSGRDQLIAPGGPDSGVGQFVSFKSTMFEFPILEYRPYRAFSTNQSSSVVFQLFAAADVPHGGSVNFPRGSAAPPLHTVWSIGLRLVFDWRYYY